MKTIKADISATRSALADTLGALANRDALLGQLVVRAEALSAEAQVYSKLTQKRHVGKRALMLLSLCFAASTLLTILFSLNNDTQTAPN